MCVENYHEERVWSAPHWLYGGHTQAEGLRAQLQGERTFMKSFKHFLRIPRAGVLGTWCDACVQVAAGTLDASTKIYAVRVDAVHADAYRVLGGLGSETKPKDGVCVLLISIWDPNIYYAKISSLHLDFLLFFLDKVDDAWQHKITMYVLKKLIP